MGAAGRDFHDFNVYWKHRNDVEVRHHDDARKLREEAQTLLASYEKKQKEAEGQVDHIIATAKAEAERAAEQAHEDLKHSIERRLKAAEDQIASMVAHDVACDGQAESDPAGVRVT